MHERYAGARTGRGELFGRFGRCTTAYGGVRFVLIFSASHIHVHHCPGVQPRYASVHSASGAARRRQNRGSQSSTLADRVQQLSKTPTARSHDDDLRSASSRRLRAPIGGGSKVPAAAPPPSLAVQNRVTERAGLCEGSN